MSRTRIDPSLLNPLSSDLNMGSHKITSLTNGSSAQDAAAFGQVPVITNWAAYSPTIAGFGTTSDGSFRWKQIGDTVYVQGSFKAGTTTATPASVTLPNSYTINYGVTGNPSGAPSLVGFAGHVRAEEWSADSYAVLVDGTTTDKVFFYKNGGVAGATMPSNNGNALTNNGDYQYLNFWFVKA